MMEYQYEIKIPKDRIAVLIGKKGEVKKELEEATKSKLTIDSNEGDVFIKGKDSVGLFTAREIIQAIGRGFNPEVAMKLLKQDYCFELINLQDYCGKSKNDLVRIKSRLIGSEGKTRVTVENLTETSISIYGKTVSVIGLIENTGFAKQALEMIIKGSPHSSVYNFLEKKRRELKRKEMI